MTDEWAFEGSPSIQSSSLVRHNASDEHKDAVSYLVELRAASNSQTEQSESRNRAILNTDPINQRI